jgi:hypothetical protein
MRKLACIGIAVLAFSSAARSAEEGTGSYDISDADRATMMDATNHYNICLREKADALFTRFDDVRQLADAAMKECEPILGELDARLLKANVAEDFRLGYVRHTKNTGGRMLLPELMARKAR